jgi:hypothetical protein
MTTLIRGDFNGVFDDLLCLSHDEICRADNGLVLREGDVVTAWDDDSTPDDPSFLLATGIVERAPDWLACKGSRWVLRVNSDGFHHKPVLPP